MGFKKQIRIVDGGFTGSTNVPESIVRQRLGNGITDKMKLGYDVEKKNETLYARYTYIKEDPLAAWPS